MTDDSSGAIHTDSSAHGNHATQAGNARATGPAGYGQELDGNDYLRVSVDPSLDIGGAVTLEAWVRLSAANSGFSYFLGKYELDNDRSYALYASDMNPRFIVSPDGATTEFHAEGTTDLPVGEWTYMAGTYDGTDGAEAVELYINGARQGVAGGPPSTQIHISGADVTLGCDLATNTPAALTEGLLDEVRIRPDRRSADWIAAQYQSVAGSFVLFGSVQTRP